MINRKQESLTFMAGEAFGSGFHPTTQTALMAMESLKHEDFLNILDMGCGSGILSLVAASWWGQAAVTAADIEEKAIETTRQNAKEAGIDRITAIRSDGFSERAVKERGPYDLIICNIIAEPIIRLAPGMTQALAPGGVAVLSGMLVWLLPQVAEAYQAAGFSVLEEFQQAEWRAVTVGKGLGVGD